MRNFKSVLILFCVCFSSFYATAKPVCIKVDSIAKWEVLDHNKTLIYDAQGNSIAFIIFNGTNLRKIDESFRFFSSTICPHDRVQTSQIMTTISSIELIRK
jgi:hypothetical protein